MSSREHLIVGLNLLRLLVYNRISEFHTDLELMDPEVPPSFSFSWLHLGNLLALNKHHEKAQDILQ